MPWATRVISVGHIDAHVNTHASEHCMNRGIMTTLITGATGGLGARTGAAVRQRRSRSPAHCSACGPAAELQAKLIKQFHVHVTSVVLDLSDTEAAEKLFRYAQEKGIVIDTLVNCAGFGDWADFMHEDRRKLNAMMQVNMVTLAKLMASVRRGHGGPSRRADSQHRPRSRRRFRGRIWPHITPRRPSCAH